MKSILSPIFFIGLIEKNSSYLVIYINKCRVPDIVYNRVAFLLLDLLEEFFIGTNTAIQHV